MAWRCVLLAILITPHLVSCGREVPTGSGPSANPNARDFDGPSPIIVSGPSHNGVWGEDVRFEWIEGQPAVGREWALLHTDEYLADTGASSIITGEVIAWMDSLQFHPGTTEAAWIATPEDFVEFEDLDPTAAGTRWIFGVRSFDEGGVRAPLGAVTNFRFFRVRLPTRGPPISLNTSYGDCVSSSDPVRVATIFRTGVRLQWDTTPGESGTDVVETAWAFGAPENWTLAGPTSGSFPPENEAPWIPDPGPVTFYVRAVDDYGLERILPYELDVWTTHTFGVLAVLDTDPEELVENEIWPNGYETIERVLVKEAWLPGRALRIHETLGGAVPPEARHLATASTIVWLHSAVIWSSDSSSLSAMFEHDGPLRSLLWTWHQAGGNLVICGINPVNALRYFMLARGCQVNFVQNDPVLFTYTLDDSTLVPHFAATELGIDRIEHALGDISNQPQENRLGVARSALPWLPDLEFNPLSWPNGPVLGGFGYWDDGVVPRDGAVVAYTANDTSSPVAVLVLNGPGRRGNSFYLGAHPYFLDGTQTARMFDGLLDAFGELRLESTQAPPPH